MIERSSGILMPISSLPSPPGIGTMGKAAYDFADFLAAAGQKYWQLLPLGPTSYGDSPYQSFSSFAGNPYFIDLDLLVKDKLLTRAEVNACDWGDDPRYVDYGKIYASRFTLLEKAKARGFTRDREAVAAFERENERWLPNYALFMALNRHLGLTPSTDWDDEDIRRRTSSEVIERYRAELREDVELFTYIQFLFFRQWEALKAYIHSLGIRIIAPIPGKGTIGIEVPNRDKQVVSMYSAVRSLRFQESKAELPVVIGRTIQNENYVFDLAKMPHLLVAGATGQGKSVGLNAIITSLLYKKHPSQLKFVMIDPKMVEFSLYSKIEKHFLAKMESEDEAIVTDPRQAVYTLNSLCTEMDNRLELCKRAGARNIAEYNDKFTARRLNPEKGHRYLPYIVVVVDEFADLIMTAREVEGPVMRLAQKARAIGIHLIIATQRPDVKVITGGIKANFPARIAFRVMQMIDSRTIIDQPGANQLIGRGDMLFSKDGELIRIQCALVETREVERIVDFIGRQQGYSEAYRLPDYVPESSGGESSSLGSESGAPVRYDTLFADIARAAVSQGQISTSSIQRNYEVGFNRAGRIMMQLERAGIVGRQEGAKPRDILFHDLPSLEARLQELGVF